jgi:ribonuclease I
VQHSTTTGPMAGTDWMKHAACKDHTEIDFFDLDCNLQACLTLCAECPVGDHCLQYAIDNECYEGVWGGEWGYRLAVSVRRGRGGRHG